MVMSNHVTVMSNVMLVMVPLPEQLWQPRDPMLEEMQSRQECTHVRALKTDSHEEQLKELGLFILEKTPKDHKHHLQMMDELFV